MSNTHTPDRIPVTILCDHAGCGRPATNMAQGQGRKTPPKVWYGCDEHAATPFKRAESSKVTP